MELFKLINHPQRKKRRAWKSWLPIAMLFMSILELFFLGKRRPVCFSKFRGTEYSHWPPPANIPQWCPVHLADVVVVFFFLKVGLQKFDPNIKKSSSSMNLTILSSKFFNIFFGGLPIHILNSIDDMSTYTPFI